MQIIGMGQKAASISEVGRELGLVLVLVLMMALGWWHTRVVSEPPPGATAHSAGQNPAQNPAQNPGPGFSMPRALADLRQIAAAPHPVGTAEHARVRGYLLAQLRAMGLAPEVQSGMATSSSGRHSAGWVHNVLVRLPGRQAGAAQPTLPALPALLLAAHYDSVPSGNGAADDGVSVAAILETLRVLRARGPLARDVIVLFSDGEEVGLLGAELFVREHPWAKQVAMVLNFDNRGNHGPALMFETGPGNGALIDGLKRAAQPMGSSIMYEIYRHMPNNTDFSVFRAAGLSGMNFGAIEGHMAYHTMQDRVELLDPGLLWHQGSLMLTLVGHFAGTDAPATVQGGQNRVYFDFPALGLVHYPQALVWPLAALLLLLWYAVLRQAGHSPGPGLASGQGGAEQPGQVARAAQDARDASGASGAVGAVGALGARALLAAALGFVLLCLALFCLGQGLWWLVERLHPEFVGLAQGDTYNSTGYFLAGCGLSLGAVLLFFGRWASAGRALAFGMGGALCWLLLLLPVCWWVPGASFVLVWPLLPVLLSWWAWLRGWPRGWQHWVLVGALVPALLLAAPLVWQIHVALTPQWLGVPLLLIGFQAALLAPLCHTLRWRRGWAAGLAGVAVLCWLYAERQAGFDADRPLQNSLSLVQLAPSGTAPAAAATARPAGAAAFWLSSDSQLDHWNRPWLAQGKWQAMPDLFGPRDWQFWAAPAPSPGLPPPVLTLLHDQVHAGQRQVRVHLASPQQAPKQWLAVEGGSVYRASLDGRLLSAKPEQNWTARLYGMPRQGATLDLLLEAGRPLRLRVIDTTFALDVPPRPAGLIIKPYVESDTTRVVQVLNLP